jgi:hypothetical protein
MGVKIARKVIFAPGKLATYYLTSTYLLFLISPLASETTDIILLTTFVVVNYLAFLFGAYFTSLQLSRRTFPQRNLSKPMVLNQKLLIFFGSIYLIAWAASFAANFGVSNPADLLIKIFSPGASYQGKFEFYEQMQDASFVSRPIQVLTILSLVYAAVVPFGAYSWGIMSLFQRVLFSFGLAFYVASFLAIGTMKGIGDITLFLMVGVLAKANSALLFGGAQKKIKKTLRRRLVFAKMFIVLICLAGAVYMVTLQVSRAQAFGLTYSPVVGDTSKTLIASVFGEDVAFAIYLVLAYPSHGYLGLSHNLSQPFEFAYGAGIAPAFESYRLQYFGGFSFSKLVYLFRTEEATGWPAGLYWSTIFPWVASDLSFIGTPLLMLGLGWLLTRIWVSTLTTGSALSLAALGQMALAIAFIPANNQVLSSRVGLWTVFSLLVIWGIKRLAKKNKYV